MISYKDKVIYDKLPAVVPKGKGLVFIKHDHMELNKIDYSFFKNGARDKDLDQDVIIKLQEIIKNEKYEPWRYNPPIVIEGMEGCPNRWEKNGKDNELGAGAHRYQAHKGLKEKTMWVAIVKFKKEDGRSARYWMRIYQINENDEDSFYIKNPRTDAAIVFTIVNIVKDPTMVDLVNTKENPITDKAIKSVLKDMNVKPHKHNALCLRVKQGLPYHEYVKSWGKEEKVNFWKKKLNLKEYEQSHLLTNKKKDTLYIVLGFDKKANRDYDRRLFDTMTKYQNVFEKFIVLADIMNSQSEEIRAARKYRKEYYIENMRKKYIPAVKLLQKIDGKKYMSDKIKTIGKKISFEFKWTPQFKDECEKNNVK